MELNITKNNRNALMKRNEIEAVCEEKQIPSKKEIREKLAAQLNGNAESIVISKVETKFGSNKAKILARKYDSVEELKATEEKHIRERNFGKEAKKEEKTTKGPAP
jgi:ribosomal protein S24E